MIGRWILVLVVSACAHRTPSAPVQNTPAAETVSPPVTLDEFRAAFPVGTSILMRFVQLGTSPMEERWTWIAADADGCTVTTLSCDEEGNVVSEDGEIETTWVELMTHATFPADRTVFTDATVDVAAGHFDTWHYTVSEGAPDTSPELAHYHFDRTLPGPPVLVIIEEGGVEVMRMELVHRDVTPPAAGSRCSVPPS